MSILSMIKAKVLGTETPSPAQSIGPKEEDKARNGRIFLKVKIKNLADEARTIRKEERKALDAKDTYQYLQLRNHRISVVRDAARKTLLAYGYIRGRAYRQIEPTCQTRLSTHKTWLGDIAKMVVKYGDEPWTCALQGKEYESRVDQITEEVINWLGA